MAAGDSGKTSPKPYCYLGSLMVQWFKPGQWSPTAMAGGAAAKQMCSTFYKPPVPLDCFREYRKPCLCIFIVILPLKYARYE